MNLYKIDCGTYVNEYYIVAGSYAEAEELWLDEYKSKPKGISFITPYVLISKDVESVGER